MRWYEQTTSKTRRDLMQFHRPMELKPAWLYSGTLVPLPAVIVGGFFILLKLEEEFYMTEEMEVVYERLSFCFERVL